MTRHHWCYSRWLAVLLEPHPLVLIITTPRKSWGRTAWPHTLQGLEIDFQRVLKRWATLVARCVRIASCRCSPASLTTLELTLWVLAQVDMLPTVRTVATAVGVAASLGGTAASAVEAAAGVAVGTMGTVAAATLGAPGQVVTAIAGVAVSAAGAAAQVGTGAVATAANIVATGADVATALAPAAPAPMPGPMGLPPGLLPSVPTESEGSTRGYSTRPAESSLYAPI